jgi:hypothetical protein
MGVYVVLLHADDLLKPMFLARAAAILDAHPDVGMVHCAVQHVDQNLAPLHLQSLAKEDRIDRNGSLLRRLLLDGCVVNPCGVMVRRSVYEKVGKFTEEIVWGVDWHMWIRVALAGPVAYLAEPLGLYRQHQQSGTSGVMATARNGSDERGMLKDIFRLFPDARKDLQDLWPQAVKGIAHRTWCFAEEMCQLGHSRAARAGIRRSIEIRSAMLAEPKVWSLWLATYLGYDWFASLHAKKQRLKGIVERQ